MKVTESNTPWKFSASIGGWDCIRDARGDVILKPANTMCESEMLQAINAVNNYADLLAALQSIVDQAEHADVALEWDGQPLPSDIARAAITKATGHE